MNNTSQRTVATRSGWNAECRSDPTCRLWMPLKVARFLAVCLFACLPFCNPTTSYSASGSQDSCQLSPPTRSTNPPHVVRNQAAVGQMWRSRQRDSFTSALSKRNTKQQVTSTCLAPYGFASVANATMTHATWFTKKQNCWREHGSKLSCTLQCSSSVLPTNAPRYFACSHTKM